MIGVALTTSETTEDYKFVFESVQKTLNKLDLNIQFKPVALMSDAAQQIQSAYKAVFNNNNVKMCFFHLRFNITKKTKGYSTKVSKEITSDIYTLHCSRTTKEFEKGFKLLENKYHRKGNIYAEFIEYFKKTWIVKNCNWYIGYIKKTPNTNNAIEGFNSMLKSKYTLREKLPMGEFFKGN